MEHLSHWFWQNGVNYLLYIVLLLVTLWTVRVIMFDELKSKYMEWNYKSRIRIARSKTALQKSVKSNNPLIRHLDLLLRTTKSSSNKNDVFAFISFSGLIAVVFSIFIISLFGDLLLGLVFGFLISSIPYLFLRLRLNKIRFLMNRDFLLIIQKLTQNYNAMHYDMYHALSETQKEVKSVELRKVLIRLVSDLQVSRNEDELRESIQVFIYTSGTNWSKRLGSIILKSYLHKEKVLNALIVLSKQMEEMEEMLEEEKSQTLDTVYNGYLTIPLFIGSLFLGKFTTGAQDWVSLQFGHKWTLLLIVFSAIGVVFSMIISIFLMRPKNDL